MRPRLVHLVVTAALALLGWSTPAFAAAVVADFDGDGILDSATLESGPRPLIRISLSRADRPVVLVLRERALSLVAADVNRDGHIDLATLSDRRGLVLFRNDRGGHFTRVRRPARGKHGFLTLLVGRPIRLHHHSAGASDEASFDGDRHDSDGQAADVDGSDAPLPTVTVRAPAANASLPHSPALFSAAPRAPPA